jgi:3-hydroxyisobutyrate dehydrogenase-like beta-hydroxyacid dehydrogenase
MLIGFSGLGQMGKHMAMNIAKKAGNVIVNDLKTDSFAEFEAVGARTTTKFEDLVDADIIFLSLPNADVVKTILLGNGALLKTPKKGQIVVDTSTITYAATMEISKQLTSVDISFLDAPVSGMEARAKDGTLTVMCGGDESVFSAVKPYLDFIGNKILFMGATGNGQLTKLINQLLYDINVAALAEILPMAVKMGLDSNLIGEVVNSGTGRSYASEFFIPRILKGEFSAGYPMKNAYKDLVSAAEISANLCIPMPVLASATSTYQSALLKGFGDLDKGGMIRVFEDMLGVLFRN